MLRSRPTIWFELLTSRQHFALAMQTLAASGAAQLEARRLQTAEPVLPKLEDFFAAFRALETEYGAYWPAAQGHADLVLEDPVAALDETLERISDWAREADPIISRIRASEARLGELKLIDELVGCVPRSVPLVRLSDTHSHLLEHAIFFLPEPVPELPEIDNVLYEVFPGKGGAFLVALAYKTEMTEVAARMASMRATPVPLPEFLEGTPESHGHQVRKQIAKIETTCEASRANLGALSQAMMLAGLLNRVAVLEWLQDNAGDVSAGRHVMRITGWTGSPDGEEIRSALDAAHVDYALTLGENAPDDPPMVLDNPGWLKAFEFFPRMLGVPAERDVDPSALTAVIAPVLFGFMFGDVGQGAVLITAGLLLRRRVPLLALLVPGGVMAMVFGLLFGSVFSVEGIIPALWLHPLSRPITVLAAALGLGVAVLLLGVALDATQAVWHRKTGHWLANFGGIVLAWVGLLGAWFMPALACALPLGLVLTLACARGTDGWSPGAAGRAAAEFLETLMRLLVSTVSFARVGAFALAHAGLSAAVVGVADAIGGPGFWVVLLLGNLLIIALEGLVTGIQTTRLVLFEFFIRFFHSEGREFRPLAAPGPHLNKGTPS